MSNAGMELCTKYISVIQPVSSEQYAKFGVIIYILACCGMNPIGCSVKE